MGIRFFKGNIANLEDEVTTENKIPSPEQSMDQPAPEEPHQIHSDQFPSPEEDVDVSDDTLTQSRNQSVSEEQKPYLTVQPNRILCGVSVPDYFSWHCQMKLSQKCKGSTFFFVNYILSGLSVQHSCAILCSIASHFFVSVCQFHSTRTLPSLSIRLDETVFCVPMCTLVAMI